jgi:hypothetical protein
MLCREFTNKDVKTKCCEANRQKEMQNTQHGTCPGSSSMMEDVWSGLQILLMFSTARRNASCAEGSCTKKRGKQCV